MNLFVAHYCHLSTYRSYRIQNRSVDMSDAYLAETTKSFVELTALPGARGWGEMLGINGWDCDNRRDAGLN